MATGISHFKSKFEGGARNNLFKVVIKQPPKVGTPIDLEQLEFLCKTSSLPASTVETLNVPYRGRDFKIAGKRTFEAWSVTIINDNNFQLRTAMEKWSAAMSGHDLNVSAYGEGTDSTSYMVDAQIYQLESKNGNHEIGYGYNFIGLWPSNVSNIEVTSEGETIEEFSVEFQYQYWLSNQGSAANIGGLGGLIGQYGTRPESQ